MIPTSNFHQCNYLFGYNFRHPCVSKVCKYYYSMRKINRQCFRRFLWNVNKRDIATIILPEINIPSQSTRTQL